MTRAAAAEGAGLLQRLPGRAGDDAAVLRFEAARAHGRCGDILTLQGKHAEAERQYDAAVALLEQTPDGPDRRRKLARCCNNLGALLKKLNRFAEAEDAYRRALGLRNDLADEARRTDAREELAATRYLLGALLAPQAGRQKEAEEHYAAALAAQERLVADGPERSTTSATWRTLNNLGILQVNGGHRAAAATFRRAADCQRRLVKHTPAVPHYRRELAHTLNNVGTCTSARTARGRRDGLQGGPPAAGQAGERLPDRAGVPLRVGGDAPQPRRTADGAGPLGPGRKPP